MIDVSATLPLYAHPSSWSKGDGGTTIIALLSAGLPGPTFPDGPVMNSIGIQHKFELGPYDAIALTGYFEVVAPEPATVALLGLGALTVLRIRRK